MNCAIHKLLWKYSVSYFYSIESINHLMVNTYDKAKYITYLHFPRK